MSNDTKHNRTARRLGLVAIVVLACALAYGLGRFGGFGWLDRSVAPEPATVRIETPKATPTTAAGSASAQSDEEIIRQGRQVVRDTKAQREELDRAAAEAAAGLDVATAEPEDLIDALNRAQAAVDAHQAALDEAERAVADVEAAVRVAEANIAELETELLTAQANRPDDLDELRRLGEEWERWRLIAVETANEAESQRRQAAVILSDLLAAVDREAELSVMAEEARRDAAAIAAAIALAESQSQPLAPEEACVGLGGTWRTEGTGYCDLPAPDTAQSGLSSDVREGLPAEGLTHPEVQAQGESLALEVVEKHREAWPWVQAAWDRVDVAFYDGRLPEPCTGARACVLDRRLVWFTLDSVRDADNREHVVLHELGHVGADLPVWSGPLDGFRDHFVGCYSRAADTDRLPEELLVDAVVQAMRFGRAYTGYGYYNGSDPFDTAPGEELDFFGDDNFSGCLVDATAPPEDLMDSIWSSLFECASGRAQDARQSLEQSLDPRRSVPVGMSYYDWDWRQHLEEQGTMRVETRPTGSWASGRDERVLAMCHGIECEYNFGWVCDGWTGFEVDCTDPDAEQIASRYTSDTSTPLTAWAQEVVAVCGES